MKKRLIGLLLAAVMLIPLLSSCGPDEVQPPQAAEIYTLYTIADATPDAIRQVELALNRLLFFRVGFCIDIVAVTEDEYDDLIANQFNVMAEFEAAKKDKKKNKSESTDSATTSTSETSEVLTGEKIIEMLEKGEDIVQKDPSLDVFLVRSYDEYFKLATSKMLTSIEDKLSSEAKVLKDYIHGTFFEAAKINKKTYGVPVNDTIGNYDYIVFDAELLDKYNYDAETMVNLSDLEEYLALIKANEPDVIPLENAIDNSAYAYMFNDGFASYVTSGGEVGSTYEDKSLLAYYGMIARYNALGYMSNSTGDENARFAVKFVSGDETNIKTLENETGHEYRFNVYRYPSATNENTIKNIYCVSKYVIANDITNVMELLTALFTESDLQDIFTYGVEGIHFIYDDNNQVVIISEDYKINLDYTGNKFISTTLQGEDPNKWEGAKKHNFESVKSKVIGFDVVPDNFEYTDNDGNKITVYEPKYVDIIQGVINKYYPSFMDGSIVEIDYALLQTEASAAVYEDLRKQLESSYSLDLEAAYSLKVKESILNSSQADVIKEEAETETMDLILSSVEDLLRSELDTKFRAELGEDATEEEIKAAVDEVLTEEYILENKNLEYTDEYIAELIEAKYLDTIASKVDEKLQEYITTSLESDLNKAINSAKFKLELDEMFAKNSAAFVNKKIDEKIAEQIFDASQLMIADFNTEIETVVNAFVDENFEKLGLKSRDELLFKIGYLKPAGSEDDEVSGDESETVSEEVTDESTGDEVTYEQAFDSYFAFVLDKIESQYLKVYPLPTAGA
ncbi:MAG TPA: hypothetical protein DCP51_09175 [Clostridiales bacterium]|nr:hypothetical protein [Clostridiales bacterium]